MERVGVLAVLEAKAGRAHDVETFLKSSLSLAQAEPKTLRWYAVRLDDVRFAIFDTFADDAGLKEHLSGEIARGLFAQADALFAKPPQIDLVEVLASKQSGQQ